MTRNPCIGEILLHTWHLTAEIEIHAEVSILTAPLRGWERKKIGCAMAWNERVHIFQYLWGLFSYRPLKRRWNLTQSCYNLKPTGPDFLIPTRVVRLPSSQTLMKPYALHNRRSTHLVIVGSTQAMNPCKKPPIKNKNLKVKWKWTLIKASLLFLFFLYLCNCIALHK